MGYTALSALLQVTVVGLLASYAMVHDGRTWLNGPTHTRFVDLRKHAALAAGPGQAVDHPRPGQAPSGFEGVQAGAGQWDAPSAPLTPVPSSVPDYAAPGQRANDPYSAPVAPSVPAVPAAPAAVAGALVGGTVGAGVPANQPISVRLTAYEGASIAVTLPDGAVVWA